MDLSQPFRGSVAVRAGATTWRRLDGPAFDRLGYDTYVAAGTVLDLRGRATAAALAVPGAVVGGYAAADILGADCAPRDATVELVVGRRRLRAREGVRLRQDVLAEGETMPFDGVTVTSPRRTMFDLACTVDHDEAVAVVDGLGRRFRIAPESLLSYPAARDNPRGGRRLAAVVADADTRAESRPETLARLTMRRAGLTPTPQLEVRDIWGVFVGRLDFAWEDCRLGAEYQGDQHRADREQWLRDAARTADFTSCGWSIIPITSDDVFRRPAEFVRRMRAAVDARRREMAGRSR
ncbi:hypothetical protein Acsp06_15830 [Actinomycetospora sp. NBRC 106375]|uniref:endonuclease domain-containing protein n=1 Tax=Actinomycetospora sp. NBRC 106375 TaxID=3032207 RepID=UPI0024A1B917|nr:hypothetical protein [Actinomycetospora sp. NBRC 106375]GLZ45398.1 hypothetical protein Acsp06_15830 [Actinomycetospora sp. NBRC 106375]